MKVFVGQWVVNIPVRGCQKVAQEGPFRKTDMERASFWENSYLWIGPGGLRVIAGSTEAGCPCTDRSGSGVGSQATKTETVAPATDLT